MDGSGSCSLLHGVCVFSYCFLPLSHATAKLHTGVLFRIIRVPVAGPEQGLHCVSPFILFSSDQEPREFSARANEIR